MKKLKNLFTPTNIARFGASLLGLIAFALMFGTQLDLRVGSSFSKIAFNEAFFGFDVSFIIFTGHFNGAILPFIGYLLGGVGALILCALPFLPEKKMKGLINLLACVASLMLLVGGIFIFLAAASFNNANDLTDANFVTSLSTCPIIAGILMMLSFLIGGASLVLASLKSKKR